jgi:hypothetical protein
MLRITLFTYGAKITFTENISRLNLGNSLYSSLHKLFISCVPAKIIVDKYAKLYFICGFGCGTWS